MNREELRITLIALVLFVIIMPVQEIVHEFGHIIIGILLGGTIEAIQITSSGGRVYISGLSELSLSFFIVGLAGSLFMALIFIILGKFFYNKYYLLIPLCVLNSLFEAFIPYIGRDYHFLTANIIAFISILFVVTWYYERLMKILEREEDENT